MFFSESILRAPPKGASSLSLIDHLLCSISEVDISIFSKIGDV